MHKRSKVFVDNIPDELKQIKQWVCWKYKKKMSKGVEKWTKPPCNVSGKIIDAQSSANWVNFDDAVAAYDRDNKIAGVGLVLTAELGLVGIDLDDCIDDAGNLEPWAADIVRKIESYTEVSPSGKGLRIFVKGSLPGDSAGRKNDKIEMYTSGRYLTITGNVFIPEGGDNAVSNNK